MGPRVGGEGGDGGEEGELVLGEGLVEGCMG